MYDIIIRFISAILIPVVALSITAIGGMFTERGGVTNIALEGIMIIGAYCGILVVNQLLPFMSDVPQLLFLLGMVAAAIGGVAFSYFHAVASVKMKADQIISATALNILAPALVLFLTMSLNLGEARGSDKILTHGSEFLISEVPILSKIPLIGDIFFKNVYLSLYIAIAIIIISYIIIYKTRFGLRLRACGENPHAADAAGINIYKMRNAGVLISGLLASLGGYFIVMSTTVEYDAVVFNYGFLAIAVLIFGNWKPLRIVVTAIFFSTLNTLSNGLSFFSFIKIGNVSLEEFLTVNLGIHVNVIKMLPFLGTIIILILTSKTSAAPKAVGQIYDQSDR